MTITVAYNDTPLIIPVKVGIIGGSVKKAKSLTPYNPTVFITDEDDFDHSDEWRERELDEC